MAQKTYELSELMKNPDNGFAINGINAGDRAGGFSIADIGDANGDGYGDVLIGAHEANGGIGQAYVVFGNKNFSNSLNLEDLDGKNGFTISGLNSRDLLGRAVSGAGDFNGDGYKDFMVSAYQFSTAGKDNVGRVYVVFGDESYPKHLSLSSLDGTNGFVINGVDSHDLMGHTLSFAGDMNKDGYDDVVMGSFPSNNAYVVLGKKEAAASLDLSSLDGTNGFVVKGINLSDRAGNIVSYAGDVNGDGYNDILIGAPFASPNDKAQAGQAYVVLGREEFFSVLELSSLDGSNGFSLDGVNSNDEAGVPVSYIGDVNNDGMSDFIVVSSDARSSENKGKGIAYAVFGRNSFSGSIDLGSLNGENGFAIGLADQNDSLGRVFAAFEDINGDGIDDIILGHRSYSSFSQYNTKIYTVFGGGSYSSYVNIDDMSADIGYTLVGMNTSGLGELSVFSHSNFLGDNSSSVIVGWSGADPDGKEDAGQAYVIYSSALFPTTTTTSSPSSLTTGSAITDTSVAKTYELSELMKNPDNGFVINGIKMNKYEPLNSATVDHWKSTSISSAGDFNGDGYEDLLLGSPAEDNLDKTNAGIVYVLFGGKEHNQTLDVRRLSEGDGLQIQGIGVADFTGFSVSSAGDFNGDGLSDVLIGAPTADPHGKINAGRTYIVFGKENITGHLDLSSLEGDNGFIMNGVNEGINIGDSSGFSVSSAGDINGDGLDDILIGSPSSDPGGMKNAGRVYVVFGKENSTKFLELSSLDGNNGFILNGVNLVVGSVSSAGFSVYGAGDLNGDKFDDILVGLPFSSPDLRYNSGEVYIIYGKNAFPEALNLEDIDESTGVVIKGVDNKDLAGFSMSSAGDINNDGIYDILIGAPFSDPHGREKSGQSYLVFGNSNLPAVIDLRTLDGTNGFYINGANDQDLSGFSLSSVGDINKDGFGDIIIGAPFAESGNKENSGKCYVLFGNNTFEKEVNLRSFNESTGITINGINSGDLSFFSLYSIKDINGDGMDAIVTLSSRPDSESQAYVIYSSAFFPTTTTTSSSSSLTTGTTITDTSFTSTTSVTGTSTTGTTTSSSLTSSTMSTPTSENNKAMGVFNSTKPQEDFATTSTVIPPSEENNLLSPMALSFVVVGCVAAIGFVGFILYKYRTNKGERHDLKEYNSETVSNPAFQGGSTYEEPVPADQQQYENPDQGSYYEEPVHYYSGLEGNQKTYGIAGEVYEDLDI